LRFSNVKAVAIYEQGNSELIHDKKVRRKATGEKPSSSGSEGLALSYI
jgi:hypothetical protein